jgi:hypothetical protein
MHVGALSGFAKSQSTKIQSCEKSATNVQRKMPILVPCFLIALSIAVENARPINLDLYQEQSTLDHEPRLLDFEH